MNSKQKRFHQTSNEASMAIELEGFSVKNRGAGKSDVLPIGVNTKSTDKPIGLPSNEKQLEVYFDKSANIKNFETRDDAELFFYKENENFARAVEKIKQNDSLYAKKLDDAEELVDKRYKELYYEDIKNNPNDEDKKSIRREIYTDKEYEELNKNVDNILKEWRTETDRYSEIAAKEATKTAIEKGFDIVQIQKDIGSFNKLTDNTIILDPNKVKTKSQLEQIWEEANKKQ